MAARSEISYRAWYFLICLFTWRKQLLSMWNDKLMAQTLSMQKTDPRARSMSLNRKRQAKKQNFGKHTALRSSRRAQGTRRETNKRWQKKSICPQIFFLDSCSCFGILSAWCHVYLQGFWFYESHYNFITCVIQRATIVYIGEARTYVTTLAHAVKQ